MIRKLALMIRNQWMGALALFLVLTGGTAMAVDGSLPGQDTVGTRDIINGEVKVEDVGQGAVASDEIANGQVKAPEIGDGEVKALDIAAGAVGTAEVANGSVTGGDVLDNSLKGADLDESTLDLGDAARAYAAVNTQTCERSGCILIQKKGVSNVTRVGTGRYCVIAPGIDSAEVAAAVTVDWSSTSVPEGDASAMTAESGGCGPDDTGFLVATSRQSLVSVDKGGVPNSVAVSTSSTPSDEVGFTIVIP